jgi:O-antigen ligase
VLRLDRLSTWALICLAATLGLGDIAQVSPPTTLALAAVRALLPIVILLAFGSALRTRAWSRLPSSIALPMAVWFALLVVSALSASTYQREAIAALERPAGGALLVWAVCMTCTTRRRWRQVLLALALGGLGIALIAVAEAARVPNVAGWLDAVHDGSIPIGDIPRVAATLSHPNEAAMLLELALPLLIACAWAAESRWRVPLALGSLAILLAIGLTFSRAGMISALAALGLLTCACMARGAREYLIVLGVAALALPLTVGWATFMDPGLDRRLLAGIDESSIEQPPRTQFWSVALDMLQDRPLLGVGPDNFRWLFTTYTGVQADNLGIHAHDQYLETLADTGVLGFVGFVWLLVAVTRAAIQGASADVDWPWRAALLASLTAWLVHAVLDDFERFWPTSIAFWLIVGLIACRPQSATVATID